jgi:short-subunit dehydrogenase involved in D-alanine esterification of teichoic acids
MSLRHQLKDTSVKVVEILPPTVQTDMPPPEERGGGIEAGVFVRSVVSQLVGDNKDEITYESEHITRGDPSSWAEAFKQFNE